MKAITTTIYTKNFFFFFIFNSSFLRIYANLCEFCLNASSQRWNRNVYIIFIFFLILYIEKFFIQKLYERENISFSDNFVVWNWFSKSIINIIRITIMIALNSLNNHFMFVIFAFYNIFFFFFFQFRQKSNTYLIIMCFSSYKQCAVKMLNTHVTK